MKGNDGTGNIIERDDWHTPQWLFDMLNAQYNFEFDCCASDNNTKCGHYSYKFERAIEKRECSWMNPPFSKAYDMFKQFFKIIRKEVAIYRCDNFETKIWQEEIFPYASWVFIPNKRIVYEGFEGKSARFPSALIGYNVDPPQELDGFTLIPEGQNKEVK